MDPVAGEFNFTRLEKVTFGPGKAAGLGHGGVDAGDSSAR